MKLVFVILAVALAFFAAEIRVKGAKSAHQSAKMMAELSEVLCKNYIDKMEPPISVCSDYLGYDIKTEEDIAAAASRHGYELDKEYLRHLFSLTTACSDEISDILNKMKEIASEGVRKTSASLESIRSSVYVFYPGITVVFALLIL